MINKENLDLCLEYIQREYSIGSLLTQWGITLKGRTIKCPLHADSRPSCVIDIENNRYHCFSCGSSGSYINLLREYKNIVEGKHTTTSKLVEEILKSDEKMQSILGFNTVYVVERETYNAELYADLAYTPYKPKYKTNMQYSNILHKIGNDIDKMLDFFALVEKDYPNQVLYDKFVKGADNGVITNTDSKQYGEEMKNLLFGDFEVDLDESNSYDKTDLFR